MVAGQGRFQTGPESSYWRLKLSGSGKVLFRHQRDQLQVQTKAICAHEAQNWGGGVIFLRVSGVPL